MPTTRAMIAETGEEVAMQRVAELEAALRPFAALRSIPLEPGAKRVSVRVNVADLARARAVLQKS